MGVDGIITSKFKDLINHPSRTHISQSFSSSVILELSWWTQVCNARREDWSKIKRWIFIAVFEGMGCWAWDEQGWLHRAVGRWLTVESKGASHNWAKKRVQSVGSWVERVQRRIWDGAETGGSDWGARLMKQKVIEAGTRVDETVRSRDQHQATSKYATSLRHRLTEQELQSGKIYL